MQIYRFGESNQKCSEWVNISIATTTNLMDMAMVILVAFGVLVAVSCRI